MERLKNQVSLIICLSLLLSLSVAASSRYNNGAAAFVAPSCLSSSSCSSVLLSQNKLKKQQQQQSQRAIAYTALLTSKTKNTKKLSFPLFALKDQASSSSSSTSTSSSSGTSSSSSSSLPPPLFEIVEDDNDDDYNFHYSEDHHADFNDDDDDSVGGGAASGFYDIDYSDDIIDVDSELEHQKAQHNEIDFIENNNVEGSTVYNYERDDDDMLTELEDRFYINEAGERVKIENCILVGVEDLSAQRRSRKRERMEMQQNDDNTAGGNNNNMMNDQTVYFTLDESLTEMRELIRTAGMEIVGEVTQRLQQVNPKTYIGTGKVKEAHEIMDQHHNCYTIVFDAELTPGQQKALENIFNKKIMSQDDWIGKKQEGEIKVIDRTALILDIFAQHAKTTEGKLQVDLALHEYRKPRLTRMWTHLERQSGMGGVGLRGPGESQLEIDKRLLRDRIITLKSKINNVSKHRSIHRRNRIRTGLPVLSLVGYTNAGKSTLLNYLTRAGVLAESMLFATLDPTTRRVKLPGGMKTSPEVLLTDTVGFIQKLPTQLVAAFRATLEEVCEADVLIHVIDVSNPMWEKQEQSVLKTLTEINALGEQCNKPIVRVLNKIDLLHPDDAEYLQYEAALSDIPYTVAVSSLHGTGMQDFVQVVEEALQGLLIPIEVEIPYNKGETINEIHQKGHVEVVDYRVNGTYLVAKVPQSIANKVERYNVNPDFESSINKKRDRSKKRNANNNQQQEDDDIGEHQSTQEVSSEFAEEEDDEEEIDWVALGRGRHSYTKPKTDKIGDEQ